LKYGNAHKNQYIVLGRLMRLIQQMTPEERLGLLKEIEKDPSRREKSQGRTNERKRYTLAVDYADVSRAFTDYLQDISTSGVFMLSRRPFQIGEELFLRINFPNQVYPFKVLAEVARTTPEGVGLRFKFDDEEQQSALASLIEALKDSTLKAKKQGMVPLTSLRIV